MRQLVPGAVLSVLILSGAARAEDVPAPPPVNGGTPKPALSGSETGAEIVPLPPERPAAEAGNETVRKTAGSGGSVLLSVETPIVEPGGQAVFSLYGPELVLRSAQARYTVEDDQGRQTASGTLAVRDMPFNEGKPRQLQVPVSNPAGRLHTLSLTLNGVGGTPLQLRAGFEVRQPQARWDQWLTLVSAPPLNGDWQALRALGVTGGMQYRRHPVWREALRKGNASFYVENVCKQMLSRYQTEPGLWEKTLTGASGLPEAERWRREPSPCAPEFEAAWAAEAACHAEAYAKDPPLFYSLASEPSMTRLAAAADFDFSPGALAEFRRWLDRDVYGTVAVLNSYWGTAFKTWNDVRPMTTDEARARLAAGVMNFAPWVDFRAFQDHTFNRILRSGANLIRRHDPLAKTGITGAMGAFAFGGWDWSQLSQTLDVAECCDIGGARALWRDLAPGKPALAVFIPPGGPSPEAAAAQAARTLWPLALEGGRRGVILWNGTGGAPQSGLELLGADGKLSPQAQALEPLLRTLNGEAGWLLAQAARTHDGVGVLYSPASVRVQWLLEAERLHGGKWLQAWGLDTAGERCESPQLRLRESWGKLLDDMGLSWRFVSSAQLESKEILRPGAQIKTLVLPRVLALSDREIGALKQFAAGGGRLVADAVCGRFDEHGILRKTAPLDELFGVDTSAEPFFPKAQRPLDRLVPVTGLGGQSRLGANGLSLQALVFSDEPKLAPQAACLAEYRRSPVLALSPAGAYLNLDLTDYLHWRLRPDVPVAQALRETLQSAVFKDRRGESPVDWDRTRLPYGTRLHWLKAGETRLVALWRNAQDRLNELGWDGDSNELFNKPEPFTLALCAPARIESVTGPQAADDGARQIIAGTLDPFTPAVFVLHAPQAAAVLRAEAAPQVRSGEVLEIRATTEGEARPALFSVQVSGPGGAARACYSGHGESADGKWVWRVPVALNDAAGEWSAEVRELLSGARARVVFKVLAR